jgi:signal transduction histidine kinase
VETKQIVMDWKPAALARAGALGCMALGGITLGGWWRAGSFLEDLRPVWLRLAPGAALALLLLGAGLELMLKGDEASQRQRPRYRMGQMVGAVAFILGFLALGGFLCGHEAAAGKGLLRDPMALARAVAARVSFPAATCAALLGLGLALLDVRIGGVRPSQGLAMAGLLVAFVGLIGYLSAVPEFYGQIGNQTGMGVLEVAGFLLLSLGVLCARPQRGLMIVLWSQTPGGLMARRLMLAPAMGLLLTGVVYLGLSRGIHASHEVRTWALGVADILFVTVPIWAAAHALHRIGLERDQAHRHLEERVQQRTAELTRANAALRASEERLAGQAAELERLVAERTAKLRETVGDLEAFSYSVAHDMRAPLRGMHGFARILLEDHAAQLGSEARDYLERIISSARRMDLLIRDALNYTQVLRGTPRLAPVNVDRIVREVVATYPEWQPPRAEIQIQGQLPSALGHEGFLGQCVSNLIGNAVKFVAPGVKPRVRIWAESRNSMVRLCFQDNGIGIPPKDHRRVFQMFGRINPATQYGGTGIGLAIVQKAMSLMGGNVDFQSEPGKGTMFWIELKGNPDTRDSHHEPLAADKEPP